MSAAVHGEAKLSPEYRGERVQRLRLAAELRRNTKKVDTGTRKPSDTSLSVSNRKPEAGPIYRWM